MITKLQLTTVCVKDQQAALEFYTEKLGFEVRTDQPFGEMRWIEVAPRGAETGLTKQPWGGLQAQFVDPDGNGFVLHD